jgi:hypothetical protein
MLILANLTKAECVSIWGQSINTYRFRPAGFAAVARGFLASGVLLRRARCPDFETHPKGLSKNSCRFLVPNAALP